jgi:hypothetical protein
MRPTADFIRLFLLALCAEVMASLLLLLTLPTDSPIETYYSNFFDYEAWRIVWWTPLTVVIVYLYGFIKPMITAASNKRSTSRLLHLTGARLASGLAIESLTSVCFWRGSHSKGIRALYESVWYWHRVPRPSDYGWRSFRGYFIEHLILWLIAFGMGLLAWLVLSRTRNPER